MTDLISEYRVLRSAAGWYLGTGYREEDWPADEMYFLPYDRITSYFETREEAEETLRNFVLNDAAFEDILENTGHDNNYVLTRLYFDDRVSFWKHLTLFA